MELPLDTKRGFSAGSTTAAVIAGEHSERGNLVWIATALRALR
jgi:hypothetical protein